jgi:hypothetical protein
VGHGEGKREKGKIRKSQSQFAVTKQHSCGSMVETGEGKPQRGKIFVEKGISDEFRPRDKVQK